MKQIILGLIIGSNFWMFSSCAVQTTATEADSLVENSNQSPNTNSVPEVPPEVEREKRFNEENQKRAEELDKQNERFTIVPKEWKRVDFKNFKYPFGLLYKAEAHILDQKLRGGSDYYLGPVFYLDLTNDKKKEAIVFITEIGCGGSCDGGSLVPYFYTIQKGKAKLFGVIKTGSRAYGCLIKSLRVENRKIYLEQFGKCKRNLTYDGGDSEKEPLFKFQAKGQTNSVYAFKKLNLVRESIEEFNTEKVFLGQYDSEISIIE
jgi:hypothetical protein